MKYLQDIGSYFLMLKRTFSSYTKADVLRELIFKEIDDLVMSSLGIVSFIGFFCWWGDHPTNSPKFNRPNYP